MKPERWNDPTKKIIPHQVGFTAPPHDFDAAPHDFLRIAPEGVGAHGRLIHAGEYAHQLSQRVDNFHKLEEVVHCMSNAGADVVGQVGTNWSHAGGKTPADIRGFCDRMEDTYQVPLHMAGMSLVEALHSIGAKSIAVNGGYFWPDWREGTTRFLADGGFDIHYSGNFVDHGLMATQDEVNEATWIFPGDFAMRSFEYVAKQAPDADALVIIGMPNFRRADGLPLRPVSILREIEEAIGKPIIASDCALYWNIFRTLGVAPQGDLPHILNTLQGDKT
ncbi:hypothetical protein ROA7450_03983 [Roseovarius albus]|uniref:Uncharacterized protein n=1 Tax=Roseovarius albus TaxID=1247867 RepID=A0A1X7A6Y0_9RHOB|nr:hypothetical protein [Roseovarius albus]SLN72084.1 hypothetical protein ROA7450_03983 [Roseovarius albus]